MCEVSFKHYSLCSSAKEIEGDFHLVGLGLGVECEIGNFDDVDVAEL